MRILKNIIKRIVSNLKEFGIIMNITIRIGIGMVAFATALVLPVYGLISLFEIVDSSEICESFVIGQTTYYIIPAH